MSKEEFEKMLDKMAPQDYVVKIRLKYKSDLTWTYTNQVLSYDGEGGMHSMVWLNDWWEGQEDVEILACVPVFYLNIPDGSFWFAY